MSREEKRNINNKSDKDYNLNVQMKVPELKKWSKDIDDEDERMNLVVRNGNDGLHY